ncbi:co-regulatory protein PtrA N-terminal domain-containing protein [Pseudomonas sp. Leaf129]|uniref:co-regulatory protein PtrA N-terminal domain-containing protein n=1 Tax=Pseudomonas sp. Leaf129 TaxID=1736268 RepID=UPI0009EAA13A|nr:co-regulatory protein PtrA N-terminal domain-containing protein [Pseudomonas sp. Leaf129]
MNLSKAVLLTLAFSISSVAYAEGGADRVFARMMDAQQTTLNKKAEAQLASANTKKAESSKACC